MYNININHLIKLSSILVYLIPLVILTGPFLPDLFLCITVIIFLYTSLLEKKYKYFLNYFSYFLFIFNFYLIINSMFASSPYLSFETSLVYFRFGVFSLAVWYLIEHNKNFLKSFCIFLTLSFILSILSGYYQFFSGENFFGMKPLYENRLILVFDDKMILGGYLSRLFPLLIGLLIYIFKPSKKYYLLVCLLFVMVDVVVFVTGERTALGLMFISTTFIIIFMSNFRILRLITAITSVLIITIITIFSTSIKERNFDQTMKQIGVDPSSERIYMISDVHESHYLTSYKMFLKNPIFGIGVNQFSNECNNQEYIVNENSCSTHPHNTYFQILAELGIIGFIFILIVIIYIVVTIFLHLKTLIYKKDPYMSDYQVCLLSCFVITFFPLLPTQDFFNNWISVIYYLPIGFYLSSVYSNK